ncbi:MAG: hypothetical protein KKA84_11195 [Bacteroidetes bacterium]|nr:hypothetical protein [Bacteroidota bacterium]
MKLIFFFSLLLLLTFSCNQEKVVDREVMVDTYVKIMINQETYKNFKDSLDIKINEIFETSNITEAEYLNTLYSYSGNKELWDSFFNESLAYLDSLRVKNGTVKSSTSPGRYESLNN